LAAEISAKFAIDITGLTHCLIWNSKSTTGLDQQKQEVRDRSQRPAELINPNSEIERGYSPDLRTG
jgi:hypothetical protein